MNLKMIEAHGNGLNWGKFSIGQLTADEWATRSEVPGPSQLAPHTLLQQIGFWTPDDSWVWVLDLQTREGAWFHVGHGLAKADLEKHKLWVCPLYEPFLAWLYDNWPADGNLDDLPATVELPEAEAAFHGHRRPGPENELYEAACDVLNDYREGKVLPATDSLERLREALYALDPNLNLS